MNDRACGRFRAPHLGRSPSPLTRICTCKPEHLSFAAKTLNSAAKDIETAS